MVLLNSLSICVCVCSLPWAAIYLDAINSNRIILQVSSIVQEGVWVFVCWTKPRVHQPIMVACYNHLIFVGQLAWSIGKETILHTNISPGDHSTAVYNNGCLSRKCVNIYICIIHTHQLAAAQVYSMWVVLCTGLSSITCTVLTIILKGALSNFYTFHCCL